MKSLATPSSKRAERNQLPKHRANRSTLARLFAGGCLLFLASEAFGPIGEAGAQEKAATANLVDGRSAPRPPEHILMEKPPPDNGGKETALRSALFTLSDTANLTVHGKAMGGLEDVPVVVRLGERTPIQALREIMAQVPGGGFVFVEGHDRRRSRAYVLGGLDGRAVHVSSHGAPTAPATRSHGISPLAHAIPGGPQIPEADYLANELLLQFPAELQRQEILEIIGVFGGTVVSPIADPLTKIGYHRIRFPEGHDVMSIAQMLVAQTPAQSAEPNYLARAMSPTPDDPLFDRQWGLQRTQVPLAWDTAHGEENVLVAVLDSGVDPSHPELEGALADGWDFISDDEVPLDDEGHGTAMAGIIAAAKGNGQGIAGIAQGITVLPVRVLDGSGTGSYAEVIAGLIYAADRGARVVNMSFGGYGESQALSLALIYAHQKGALLIGAAGNAGINARVFPAADPHVIGVASTTVSDERSSASNWGNHVLLAAPGERIPTLLPKASYALVTGTSAAAAHVSGIAALAFSANPELLNVSCTQLLIDTAADLGPEGLDERFGFGRVNAARAVAAASAH